MGRHWSAASVPEFRILPLRHIEASKAAELLAPLTPRGALVSVETKRNVLLLAGSRPQLDLLEATVQAIDLDQLQGMSFALKPLRYASPASLAEELTSIFGSEEGTQDIRFVPVERMNALVIVTKAIRQYRPHAVLGRTAGSGRRRVRTGTVRLSDPERQGRRFAIALGQIFGARSRGQQIGGLAPGFGRASFQSTLRRNQRVGWPEVVGQGGLGQGGLGGRAGWVRRTWQQGGLDTAGWEAVGRAWWLGRTGRIGVRERWA